MESALSGTTSDGLIRHSTGSGWHHTYSAAWGVGDVPTIEVPGVVEQYRGRADAWQTQTAVTVRWWSEQGPGGNPGDESWFPFMTISVAALDEKVDNNSGIVAGATDEDDWSMVNVVAEQTWQAQQLATGTVFAIRTGGGNRFKVTIDCPDIYAPSASPTAPTLSPSVSPPTDAPTEAPTDAQPPVDLSGGSDSDGAASGVVFGAGIGGAVLLLAIAVALWRRRQRHKSRKQAASGGAAMDNPTFAATNNAEVDEVVGDTNMVAPGAGHGHVPDDNDGTRPLRGRFLVLWPHFKSLLPPHMPGWSPRSLLRVTF